MSRRSIRKITAIARRESYRALKHHIKGHMWVDTVTEDTHLHIFSDDYLKYFWSHLTTACNSLRPLADGEICATPEEVCTRIDGKEPAVRVAGYIKIVLSHSEFFLKRYGDRLSCGPHFPGNTVLNINADDMAGLIAAYDLEVIRKGEVTARAIQECNAEAVAQDIALANAKAAAVDIITREGIEIEVTHVGRQRVKYLVTLSRDPCLDTEFWADMKELRPRLTRAVRVLHHKERMGFR